MSYVTVDTSLTHILLTHSLASRYINLNEYLLRKSEIKRLLDIGKNITTQNKRKHKAKHW